MWSAIATWKFSLQTIEKAKDILEADGTAMDAAEAGVRLVESDPTVESVGRGGFLNAAGNLELDGAIMDGTSMKIGVVAGVQGFEHPVTIARAVLEHSPHAILVGAGAERFAREMGIPEAERDYLITEAAKKVWADKKSIGHDTIGAVILDSKENIAVATSTSGASMKTPGRVGDSPIIGSGFYAESGIGGAAATGWGEDIMRTCCSFRAVDLMRGGMPPQKAAEIVVRTAHETILRHGGRPDCIALVCMNAAGEYGGAANHIGFTYACGKEGIAPAVVHVEPIIDKDC